MLLKASQIKKINKLYNTHYNEGFHFLINDELFDDIIYRYTDDELKDFIRDNNNFLKIKNREENISENELLDLVITELKKGYSYLMNISDNCNEVEFVTITYIKILYYSLVVNYLEKVEI